MSIPSVDLNDLSNLKELYEKNGFVLVKDVFTPAEVAELKQAMEQIVADFDPAQHPKSVFDTYDEERHVADTYFLRSAANISFFYEDGAVDEAGHLKVPAEKALNKVGHALHVLNPTFKKFSFDPRIRKIVKALDFSNPQIVQSMYIFKQPGIGGGVAPHVDATFVHAARLLGVWVALDGAAEENGCLRFAAGSHRDSTSDSTSDSTTNSTSKSTSNSTSDSTADSTPDSTSKSTPNSTSDSTSNFTSNSTSNSTPDSTPDPTTRRFVRTADGRLRFEGAPAQTADAATEWTPVPVPPGSLVLIHGRVPHHSAPNTSARPRHAYAMHLVQRPPHAPWPPTNWLQETDDYKFPALY